MRSQKIVFSLLVIFSFLIVSAYSDDSINNTINQPYTTVEPYQSSIHTHQVSNDCDMLRARDWIMNDLIDRYPPVLMRIEERPLFFECLDFNEVEIKLLCSIYDPAPYCGTVAGTYFKGYWTPDTYVGVYVNKRLVKTLPLQLGKTTFTLKERNRPFRPVKGCLQGTLEITKDEVPIKVLGYCVKSRVYDKKEESLKPYFLPHANERIVERHFGNALVYKLSFSVLEYAPNQLTGPYYETGYTPSPSCSVPPLN